MPLTLSGTTGVSGVDGTAATPAVRGGDANTGFVFGTDIVQVIEGGAESARFDASGNLLVGVTSANANGGVLQLKSGITFPATQVASTDANTLDDYEEGTFTPRAGDGTTAMASVRVAKYTKIGNLVTIDLDVTFPNPNPTNNNRLTNLPFAGSTADGNGGIGVGYCDSASIPAAHVSSTTTNLTFFTASAASLNMSNIRIICSIVYKTS